jgi:EAL domain-containing protein (putative c-di-GMP-specific phosphodiesterase class I)
MNLELAGWADPVTRLRDALRKNEFELYCQPIQELSATQSQPMAEVLVRMREEERALLPPGEFLPAFEHYGMMPQLDRWVVFHAVQRLSRGFRIPRLTVNVSAQTLQDAEFLPYVEAAAQKYGVPTSSLLFEIDESDVLGRVEQAVRFAGAAKTLGCGVLIDGFGRRAASFTPL